MTTKTMSLVFILCVLVSPRVGLAQCLACAEHLTGDWHGSRNCLAEGGITFDLDVGHYFHGVASGGLDQRFVYGGHGDYVSNIDFGKLGIQQGLFVKLRAEHRFGENINGDTGAFLPATIQPDLPIAGQEDLLLTNVLFTQMFSEHFGVFAGKLDTLDGDANAFAHGRGKEQFMNTGFVVNPIALRTVPYSTLGFGFVLLNDYQEPMFTYTVLNAVDTANRAGFDELFEEGVAMSAELRLRTNFFDMPGLQLFAGTWNSREFVALGQDPRVVLPNQPINRTTGSWSLYWNFDQYLFSYCDDPSKGWGVFGRAGIADQEANPLARFLSFGVGGNVPHCSLRDDTFGIGWYYAQTSDEIGPLLQVPLGPIGDGHGVELFYRSQVTPWLAVTPDMQILMPARENVDTALAFGVRAVMEF